MQTQLWATTFRQRERVKNKKYKRYYEEIFVGHIIIDGAFE